MKRWEGLGGGGRGYNELGGGASWATFPLVLPLTQTIEEALWSLIG